MSISIANIVLLAKRTEIKELKALQVRAQLAGISGHMVHCLQSERGASSIYLASKGKRFASTRQEIIQEANIIESLLRHAIEGELENGSFANGKIVSQMAWVLLGLDAFHELRNKIDKHQIAGEESVASFSRLIAGLISLIFELADTNVNASLSRLLVSLFSLVEGKELSGQERAVGALVFGAGACDHDKQQRLRLLVEGQQRNFEMFLQFSPESLHKKWQEIDKLPCMEDLINLRNKIQRLPTDGKLNTNLSQKWFDYCSERITAMWSIQRKLIEAIQAQSERLISEAEKSLEDSQGLIEQLKSTPPGRNSTREYFFDQNLPVEQALNFRLNKNNTIQHQPKSVMELLQAQSTYLANVEEELSTAQQALNDRKLLERAKGLLMAKFQLTEQDAYKEMRKAAMEKNLRLTEVAERVINMSDTR